MCLCAAPFHFLSDCYSDRFTLQSLKCSGCLGGGGVGLDLRTSELLPCWPRPCSQDRHVGTNTKRAILFDVRSSRMRCNVTGSLCKRMPGAAVPNYEAAFCWFFRTSSLNPLRYKLNPPTAGSSVMAEAFCSASILCPAPITALTRTLPAACL